MKTQDLIGAQLDWAVAKCEGYALTSDGISNLLVRGNEMLLLGPGSSSLNYSPTCYWMQGGEIIEREGIGIRQYGDFPESRWQADKWAFKFVDPMATGPTPLIAAMRCFCASRLGDEINIPEELL